MKDSNVSGEGVAFFTISSGKLVDARTGTNSSYMSAWDKEPIKFHFENEAHFGYVISGETKIHVKGRVFPIYQGMYFSIPGKFEIDASESQGIVMTRVEKDCFFQIGGPVESTGRLQYIDGSTDSLLVSPIKFGDPCFNLLCFPEGVDQTAHVHSSDRLGAVISGKGECEYWDSTGNSHTKLLQTGTIFHIAANTKHKFRSTLGECLNVVAYHPDSDFGPTDGDHPMINRTLIEGKSAGDLRKNIEQRTQILISNSFPNLNLQADWQNQLSSLDLVELVSKVESEFKISVNPLDYERKHFSSFYQVCRFVEKKVVIEDIG